MGSTLDRYVIRETLPPFLAVLLVLTFVLEIPPIIESGEKMLAAGASLGVVTRILLTLVPQALGVTIPMSLLIGLLIALGRLSADREVVALQACGVGVTRLLRPVGVLAAVAGAATLYVMIVAVPAANLAFQTLRYEAVTALTESQVRPHVFFQSFPGLVIYAGDAAPDGGWQNVFVADTGQPDAPRIYTAARGELRVDNEAQVVQMVLEAGEWSSADLREPERHETSEFERAVLTLDPATIFPRGGPLKGENEMTIAELRARIAEMDVARESARQAGGNEEAFSTHNLVMAIHRKFALPVACLVFAVLALPLGVTTRKEGKLASFVLGGVVVYVYYLVMSVSGSLAKGHQIPPGLAAWLANLLLGMGGFLLLSWRTERALRIPLPFRRRAAAQHGPAVAAAGAPVSTATSRTGPAVLRLRVPRLPLPAPTILDRYVIRSCARAVAVASGILLGLFYIVTFIDLSDKLFKGDVTGATILSLLWFSTPQYIYYIVPIAVLIGTLMTIGGITKNSELVVMKACGISLYRVAAPLLALGLAAGGCLFVLDEGVLAFSNRRATSLNDAARGRQPRSADALNRRWLAGRDGRIYHYVYFDRQASELNSLSIYELDESRRTLAAATHVQHAAYDASAGEGAWWEARGGWMRRMAPEASFARFEAQRLRLEPPATFGSEEPDAELMGFTELRDYVRTLEASGFDVVPYVVSLHRKAAFPFVALVMTLIAVPFAVATGKQGAMYGVGAGIVLAIVYWTVISLFAAIGSAGLLPPILAAWAPNLLFGTVAVYLILTVRT